tara:strand:- start:293 stop:532 length:240 start_codon:yes stop_codon:yes gene_type:complete
MSDSDKATLDVLVNLIAKIQSTVNEFTDIGTDLGANAANQDTADFCNSIGNYVRDINQDISLIEKAIAQAKAGLAAAAE